MTASRAEVIDVPLRVLLLGPVPTETTEALERLPGGVDLLSPAEAQTLLSRIAGDQPDVLIEGGGALDWVGPASGFHHVLECEFVRSVRYRHPLSVLVVGIDGVRDLSATHGGDGVECFRAALFEMLRRSVRRIDVVAQTGIDEVAILLPETAAAGASIVAERIRALSSRLIVKGPGTAGRALPIKASVSVGLCDAPRDGLASAAAFLSAARAARLTGERAGGDRIEVASV